MGNRLLIALGPWYVACMVCALPVWWLSTLVTVYWQTGAVLVLSGAALVFLLTTHGVTVNGPRLAFLLIGGIYLYATLWFGVTAAWLVRGLLGHRVSLATVGGIYAFGLAVMAFDLWKALQKRSIGFFELVVSGERTTNEGE